MNNQPFHICGERDSIPGFDGPMHATCGCSIEAEPIAVAVGSPYADPKPRTFYGYRLDLFPAGSVLVVHKHDGDVGSVGHVIKICAQMREHRPDLAFIIVPPNTKVESWSAEQCRILRDRLNEIIYDKERAK